MNKALDDMTVAELRTLAKGLMINGYGKLNKPELVALIKEFAKSVRRVRAKAPMSAQQRADVYAKQNNGKPLTKRQEKQIDRMFKRENGRTRKVDLPNV